MEDKYFVFTDELTKRMLQLRFANDQLFKNKKQPWIDFHDLLMKKGFPPALSVSQLRKKWTNLLDSYKIAKKERRVKKFKYYNMFKKHLGKYDVIDKYVSWPDPWRLKLAVCVSEAKEHETQQKTMWRAVERAMRSQDLPEDCCIQDIQGLWHHIKIIFRRHHRKILKSSNLAPSDTSKQTPSDWPLYDVMLEYFGRHEPEQLAQMQSEGDTVAISKKSTSRVKDCDSNLEFHWSTDITESFVQLRLQNDHLFYEMGQAWKQFTIKVLQQEHGFPETLSPREACKKWASLYGEYQKAKATKNASWHYYNLFELYLGEGSPSLNPMLDWEEKWALKLIEARASFNDCFSETKDPCIGWREVEKELRRNGIPLDYSLLDLSHIWSYLIKTYKWKRKFANKGVLKEQWPYFEPMTKCMEIINRPKNNKLKNTQKRDIAIEYDDVGNDDHDEDEDDIKLYDLKQKMEIELKPNDGLGAKQCRACAGIGDCIDIFEQKDKDGVDVASKLLVICGIEVEKTDNLPNQICNNCLEELEKAYKFRRKCQTVNAQFRDYVKNIKIEIVEINDPHTHRENDDEDTAHDAEEAGKTEEEIEKTEEDIKEVKISKKTENKPRKKYKYFYYKVCEICGVRTSNLKSHVDSHNAEKQYSCDVCGKKFKFRNTLIAHCATHRATYTPKTITCEICGRKLFFTSHYKRHMAYHKNERKYACDTCGKRFNDGDILKVHKLIHTDERPFVCSECGKTFRTAGCVSRHKRIVHKIMRKVQ